MANLDKTSVRAEVERLKSDFDTLRRKRKVSAEVVTLMNSMFVIIELILSIFLERTTQKTSRNSSLPPSQTEHGEDAALPPGSNSKGKPMGHDTVHHRRVRETVAIAAVTVCEGCGENLEHTAWLRQERRTKIDIVFEKVVEHVDAEIKQCPTCDSLTKGNFPADMPGPLHYGNGLKAFVINLLVAQMVSLNRVAHLVQSMIGTLLADATLLQFVLRLHEALEDWEQRTIANLLKAPVMHVDETSLRVDKANQWIHVYAAGDLTLKCLHPKRGKDAIEAFAIPPQYGGIIIHDCWKSYLSYGQGGHGLCGAHLLRELTFIVESNDYTWARQMKALLQKTCLAVAQSSEKRLDETALARLQKRYRTILTQGELEMPEIPEKTTGKPGKLAKSDAHNLLERFREHEAAVLLFARNPLVPFTNNRSERDLRMAKVKQKVSGCFRNKIYAAAYCRIPSYLQTMAYKGVNPMIAIQMALAGEV